MVETFLILLGTGYLIYKVAFGIPKQVKRTEEKLDMLKLHLQEIQLDLNEISKRINDK
ncbi:hypothetical protein [Clostridium formicaceticum]|uniref:Uncharacterized protein n=1 Tax=Clostridium formicaceticum TaxID=1497 RepID=A0AAC9RMI2_9CLOT|nr:hypothetical protein [Clostridium formicaceticum]ARE87005.1 hypothetical protein CLFO_13900 [Clostridium formicaceticum]